MRIDTILIIALVFFGGLAHAGCDSAVQATIDAKIQACVGLGNDPAFCAAKGQSISQNCADEAAQEAQGVATVQQEIQDGGISVEDWRFQKKMSCPECASSIDSAADAYNASAPKY